MASKRKKSETTLGRELLTLMAAALTIAVFLYLILSLAISSLLDGQFNTDKYYKSEDQRTLDSLEDYIKTYEVSSDDWYMLNQWVERSSVSYMAVYSDEVLTYQYRTEQTGSDNSGNINSLQKESSYEEKIAYQVTFSDGQADVIINGRYAAAYYYVAALIELLIPCIVFILIIVLGVKRKVSYIVQLSEEVHILDGGGLDHPVTVSGRDELAQLASSIEELRVAFIHKLDEITKLQDETRDFVTEMSHDLRTPMTPLLVYLGMLREKRYTDEEDMNGYVERAYEKAFQLKHMSDDMFSHILLNTDYDIRLEQIDMAAAFYDQLSVMADSLATSGIRMIADTRLSNVEVLVNTDMISRIFNNLVSNILKYSDPEEPVRAWLFVKNGKVVLRFSNVINELADYSSSTGFGVKNIHKMMAQMSAECNVTQTQDLYTTVLTFDIVSTTEPPAGELTEQEEEPGPAPAPPADPEQDESI